MTTTGDGGGGLGGGAGGGLRAGLGGGLETGGGDATGTGGGLSSGMATGLGGGLRAGEGGGLGAGVGTSGDSCAAGTCACTAKHASSLSTAGILALTASKALAVALSICACLGKPSPTSAP